MSNKGNNILIPQHESMLVFFLYRTGSQIQLPRVLVDAQLSPRSVVHNSSSNRRLEGEIGEIITDLTTLTLGSIRELPFSGDNGEAVYACQFTGCLINEDPLKQKLLFTDQTALPHLQRLMRKGDYTLVEKYFQNLARI